MDEAAGLNSTPLVRAWELDVGWATWVVAGGDHVDFQRLRDIDALFAHRWDVFVIASLAEADGPLRFNQLAHAVSENTQTRMIDSTLTRIKDRLIRAGLVHATLDGDGHAAYALTPAGQARADIIRAITDAIDPSKRPAGNGPPRAA